MIYDLDRDRDLNQISVPILGTIDLYFEAKLAGRLFQ